MKTTLLLLSLVSGLVFCFNFAGAAPAATNQTGFRLTIELQDGSRIVGKSGDETFQFHSDVLGAMKLPLEKIRSIECQSKTNSAKLATANGDTLAVQFAMKEVRVETAFGNFRLPVNLIKRVQVSAMRKTGPSRPGLVALWSGEGNGDDVLSGNNATLLGDVSFAEGKVGQAFSLNGFSSCMKISSSPALNMGEGGGLTITAWIKPFDVSGFHPIVEWNTGSGIGVQIWIGARPGDQGVLHADVPDDDGNGHPLISSPGTIVNGSFQHVALTYDKGSGEGVLYLNGTIVAHAQWGSFDPLTKGDFWISRRPGDHPGDWTYNAFFAGLLDEVSIYNRALTSSEIQAICVEENNDASLPPPPTSPRVKPSGGKYRDFSKN